MLQDIQNQTINMVITKDLSRLGRDYIKTGFYIEDYFPKNNVRYVAITDGIDTYLDSSNNDITPFKAIMNDMYAKDISKKIRSVYREKQKNGEYMCSIPPYGYKKHPSEKNKLVVDEKVKNIVRKIFNMYVNGHGCREIVNFLNSNKFLSPSGYRKTGIVRDKTNYNWNEVTICNMLRNEVYIGNTVQNKKTIISYKVKKIRKVDKDEQIKVKNTHKAIIDEDIFKKVQCIIEKRGTNAKLKHEYLLRGVLYCYHCKRKLQIVLKNNKPHPYITCSNAKSRGCYPLNMNYEKFEKYIIRLVTEIIKTYVDKELLRLIYKNFLDKTINNKEDSQRKIEQIDKEIFIINNNIENMYTDKLKGILQEEDYLRIFRKI